MLLNSCKGQDIVGIQLLQSSGHMQEVPSGHRDLYVPSTKLEELHLRWLDMYTGIRV